jgi:hypothetical protein
VLRGFRQHVAGREGTELLREMPGQNAAEAGRWELVEVLARELNRRGAGTGSVVTLAPTRTANTRAEDHG